MLDARCEPQIPYGDPRELIMDTCATARKSQSSSRRSDANNFWKKLNGRWLFIDAEAYVRDEAYVFVAEWRWNPALTMQ